MSRFISRGLLFCSVLSLLTGCEARALHTPASGSVKLEDGTPCDGALVVFHPQDEGRLNDPKPVATCEADGSFVLTTMEPDDGALPGQYGVTIVWIGEEKSGGKQRMSLSGEGGGGGSDRLKGKYGSPQNPRLSAEVKADQPNNFDFVVSR